jgi:hypothetical protein
MSSADDEGQNEYYWNKSVAIYVCAMMVVNVPDSYEISITKLTKNILLPPVSKHPDSFGEILSTSMTNRDSMR